MDSFYFIILAIAVLILIMVLAVVGWMMTKNVAVQKFPGITTTCPDYWTISPDGKCVRPDEGRRNRGSALLTSAILADKTKTPGGTATSFDSNDAGWSKSGDSICAKKKWATTYGVNWDTVVNSSTVC
jgi:hypothetical protein